MIAALTSCALAFPSQCGNTSTYKNATAWRGRPLGNLTSIATPAQVGLVCCAIASAFAKERSSNITDGVPWSALVLGPSKTQKGKVDILCSAYDYGAKPTGGNESHTAGFTPRVTPLPPPPPPIPPCGSFATWDSCPKRCFWSFATGCAASPPIECGCNSPGGCGNNALCVHVVMNTTTAQTWDYLGDASSYNQTVTKAPPQSFSSRDMWYSMQFEVDEPSPLHLHVPFRYCVQFGSGKGKEDQFAICLSMDGGGVLDLQCATTKALAYSPQWQSNVPLVAEVVIRTNSSADLRWLTSNPSRGSAPQSLIVL